MMISQFRNQKLQPWEQTALGGKEGMKLSPRAADKGDGKWGRHRAAHLEKNTF